MPARDHKYDRKGGRTIGKQRLKRARTRSIWPIYGAICALCGAFLISPVPADGPSSGAELVGFCGVVQRVIAATALAVDTVAYADREAFIKSKAALRPLVARQHVDYDEQARPRLISCKVKTSDVLVSEYGAEAAGHEGRCSSVNALTLERVAADMASAGRRYGKYADVILEPDDVGISGINWLKPYTMLWSQGDTLHIRAKALRVDWSDPRFADAPARFRGTHYCHLVAPSYLRRVLAGEVGVPDRDM